MFEGKKEAKKEAKKEKKSIKMDVVDYWEWRTTIEEWDHATTKKNLINLKFNLMAKEIELMQLKTALFRSTVDAAGGDVDAKKLAYNKFKDKLEKDYKTTLSGAVINENFEITYPEITQGGQ